MSSRIAFLLLFIVATSSSAVEVGRLPLYVYVSLSRGRVTAWSEIQLDRDIDVATRGLPHTLTGRVIQSGGKLFARLNVRWNGGAATYDGEVQLDRPVYATSASSGSIVLVPRFIISHRLDVTPLLESEPSAHRPKDI